MSNYLIEGIIGTLMGEYGIVKVLEIVDEKSYHHIIHKGIKNTILEFNTYNKNLPKLDHTSCSCPGCTGRG